MKTWTVTGALFVAGAMLAGSVFAQTSTPSAPGQMDKAKSGTTTEGAGKTDTMKSDTKSDSGAAKSGSGGRMMGGKKEHVKAAQQALKDKGHDPGSIDGVMGPKTQAALKDFQSKEGLKASGQLDTETMSALGVQAKAGAAADTSTSSPSASPSPASPKSGDAAGAKSGDATGTKPADSTGTKK
jgi:peptidoglycan hydrolase-like protein with peptidoglycan-binding domain